MDAASIGLHILEKRADVAVFDLCFSACANYIFLAGRRKYLAADTLLAWHGAPPRSLTAKERVLDTSGRLAMTRHRSEQFFAAAGVDRRVASQPDVTLPDYAAWRSRADSAAVFGWTWTRTALEQRFDVKGIVAYWYPAQADDLRRLALRHDIDLLVDR